jgi:hypothetical protein
MRQKYKEKINSARNYLGKFKKKIRKAKTVNNWQKVWKIYLYYKSHPQNEGGFCCL